jgi:hypothetical protein
MSDTTALQHVLDSLQTDITRRSTLIRTHAAAAAELEAANRIDAAHAEVAAELIAQLRGDESATWAPAQDIEAAALVASAFLPSSPAGWGKTESRALNEAPALLAVAERLGVRP